LIKPGVMAFSKAAGIKGVIACSTENICKETIVKAVRRKII
jgi:hypothetical protein